MTSLLFEMMMIRCALLREIDAYFNTDADQFECENR